jgi:hypothetical protein
MTLTDAHFAEHGPLERQEWGRHRGNPSDRVFNYLPAALQGEPAGG